MQNFSVHLKELREYLGMNKNKFAEFLDLNNTYISQYEAGRSNPKDWFFIKLKEKVPGLNVDWLKTGEGKMFEVRKQNLAPNKEVAIPLIENVTCGVPIASQIESDTFLTMYDTTMKNKNVIAVKAKGASMDPYIRENDILLCYKLNRGDEIKENKAYIIDFKTAAVGTKEGICKLVNEEGTKFNLTSINTYWKPILVPKEEIRALYKVYKLIRNVS